MSSRNVLFATLLASIASGAALIGFVGHGVAQRRPTRAPIPSDVPPRPENVTECNYQEPIDFLVRENFVVKWRQSPAEQEVRRARHEEAVRWRTEHFGYFEGFGQSTWNASTPSDNATRATFMGLPVRVNAKVVPALACVEAQIRSECGDSYRPGRLSGLRTRNTYHNGEVSNHVYGIAVDVDPNLNTCCMCVAQWGDHPLCQREVESIYERMAMPSCWVHVFERFGFYWLGRDALQDTMHFEFLGHPDYVLKSQGPPPAREPMASAPGEGEAGVEP